MGRAVRHLLGLLLPVLLLCPACSDDTTPTVGQATVTTTPGDPAAADPGDPSTPSDPSDPSAPTEGESADPGTDPGTPPGSSPGTAAPPATAAGGWRLVVTQPTAGATVGRAAVLCYEITGPTRASVALEVAVGGGAPVGAAAAVGRGSASVELAPDPDPQDLRVQLLVDGKRLDGATVTIPAVLIVPAAVAPDCA